MSFHERLPVRFAPRGRRDLVQILHYTGEMWGARQQVAYWAKLDHALDLIAEHPEIGHRRDDLPTSCRAYLAGSHLIVHRAQADFIGVLRVLHRRTNPIRHL